MSIVAEFTIDAEQFLLGRILRAGGDMNIEVERVVPASKQVMPYVWVSGGDRDAFEVGVRDSPEIRGLTHLDTIDGRALYRVEWNETVESLLYGMVQTDATILEAQGRDNWLFRIRFNNHESLSAFADYCANHEITIDVGRIHDLASADRNDPFGLTPEQRETLELAVEAGYFKVPRQATLTDLAERLGVSQQAVSERLRRGIDRVLRSLVVGDTNTVER